MDKIKLILTLIAVILGSLAVLATIGFISSLLQSLLLLGFVCLAGYVGVRLWLRDKPRETDSLHSSPDFKKIERTLEEYRRKLK